MEQATIPGMDTGQEQPRQDSKEKSGNTVTRFARKKPVLFTVILGLLALGILYAWKEIQANRERTAIVNRAEEQMLETNTNMLKLVIKPFIWSIRAEMLRENLEQVNIYTSEMVREKNFQLIQLAEPGGKILISTDKKSEGQPASGAYTTAILQTDSVIVTQHNGLLTVAAPVMGFDKKLGVLIMEYRPERFLMKKEPAPVLKN